MYRESQWMLDASSIGVPKQLLGSLLAEAPRDGQTGREYKAVWHCGVSLSRTFSCKVASRFALDLPSKRGYSYSGIHRMHQIGLFRLHDAGCTWLHYLCLRPVVLVCSCHLPHESHEASKRPRPQEFLSQTTCLRHAVRAALETGPSTGLHGCVRTKH
eukprot:Skav226578  [mRNA]  locus=scaffold2846:49586:55979:- [translate_table: standard]